jgi:acyl-coenzyme A synthetase/AMP-(fatty) acid ligase/3-hydroxymyristoyl/3-hydroxydecanoyl-(acyl carrier protein) dehydratase
MGATSTRLSQLLQHGRDPLEVIAWRYDARRGGDEPVTWGELCAAVEALGLRLQDEPKGAWILACGDRLAFAVGLLALWQTGRCAIAPPNTQAASLASLAYRAAGVVTDLSDLASGLPTLSPLDPIGEGRGRGTAATDWRGRVLDPAAEVLELSTSGTTGVGKPTIKHLAQLEEEVAHLEAQWGERLAGVRIFSTASHQHLYGLLFGLLWPLCSGRAFQVECFLHAGELFPRMLACRSAALASVPAHLKRMADHDDAGLLRDVCRTTFSSGGPLAPETADRWRAALGAAPIEVFGSTETGGVAWRMQEPGARRLVWTPFAPVEIERLPDSGCLRVRSPFVSPEEGGEGFVMGDRVRLDDAGGFLLEGRADRVVKVGEKRLSLPLMEEQLCAHDLVEEAALVLLDQGGEARVGAVVVPSQSGRLLLERAGRRAVAAELTAHLANRWDRVLLPRAWRMLDQLVEDAQGKVTAGALRALFAEPDADSASRPTVPELEGERSGMDFCERDCRVPNDLAQLEGHFDGMPIVPGVAQVDWAARLAEALVGGPLGMHGLEALKFPARLLPGRSFTLRVERTGPKTIRFRLWCEDEEFASGRFMISAGDLT